jgi:hypothetical protein
MSDYAQDARDVDAGMREDGQLIALSLKQPGAYINGAVVPGAPILESVWGIETGVTLRDLGVGTVNGTLVQSGDRKLTISSLADTGAALTPPKVGDLATIGTQVYTIKNVDKLSPGGVVVMYTLVTRI